MINVFISPSYSANDPGSYGGIARVVEGQRAGLAKFGINVVDSVGQADILAIHAGAWVTPRDDRQVIVAHCHGLYWEEYDWDPWALELNQEVVNVMKRADAVTAPSKWVANALARGLWMDAKAIYHGVDATKFTPEKNLGYVLWNKARVDPICDVAPCEILANMCPDIRFISTYGHTTANLQVTGLVPHDQEIGLLSHANVYLCNTRETFGIGTLEALACGVPILGWRWGGQAEFIEHKKHGWLATPGDFDSLKEGLRWCIAHRDEISSNCVDLAKQFTWDRACEQYALLYTETWERVNSQKRVSVIITSYNLSKYLPEAIKSVTSQLTDQDELIVVDDCSTDDSLEVAQGLCNNVVQTPKNLYLAGALNFGVEHSTGRYILNLDADNFLAENTLNTLAHYLDHERNLDMAYGKIRFIEEGKDELVSNWPPLNASVSEQLKHHNQVPSTCLYRRRMWERISGYRRRCRTAEDADFWCRALSFGFTGRRVTDAVTFTYRNRQDSMSHVNKEWPWEAWYPGFENNYAVRCANYKDKHSNIPSYEPPIISVIIPVGPGHEEAVIDALDSLSAQSFIKWEAIVINDTGSKIKTLPPFVRIYSTSHRGSGTSSARNIGLSNAKGRYIMFLDADDFLDPSCLEKLYRVITKTGGYVYSDYRKVESEEVRELPSEACKDILQMLTHPITALYPNIEDVRFDESFKVGEDWDYVANMIHHGYCGVRVPEPLLYYRTTSGSNRVELLQNVDMYRNKIISKYKGVDMCGCGKGGGQVFTAQQLAENFSVPNPDILGQDTQEELVLLEFLPENTAPLTYRGRVTSKEYRFGSGIDRLGYVHVSDAEYFLTRSAEFRIADRERVLSS